MKYKITTVVGLLALTTSLFASNGAENLFDSKCAMCHSKTMPQDKSKLVAPPFMGVMRHIKMQYPKKKDAVAFIVDYAQNPSRAKALCKEQKIAKFGLMPSQKGNITLQELQTVASWAFDHYSAANFRGHNTMMLKTKGMNCKHGKCKGMQ